MPKKIYIRTFGCQMNERDSEFVMGLLMEEGFKKAESIDGADVVLFNTCSVRKHAEDRAISNMGILLRKKRYASKIFGIIGCSAQALKEDLFKNLPKLNLVCGTGEIHRLPQLIKEASKTRVAACGDIDKDFPEAISSYRENKDKTSVSIMRGCNNYCSYCIVPYVRGPERSRKPEDIIKEIEGLAKKGFKEVMLLGQNVNSYKGEGCDFVGLLKLIDKIDGIKKVKFMTSHPKDATIELFKAMKDLKNVSKELHLPIQSGSDRILELMKRGYTAAKYKNLTKELRSLIPGCKITTDIIVGFPTETEEDFKKTYDLMKEIKFNAAFMFKYSPRSPAKSAELEDDVPKKEKERRHKMILDLQKTISKRLTNEN